MRENGWRLSGGGGGVTTWLHVTTQTSVLCILNDHSKALTDLHLDAPWESIGQQSFT